MTINAHRVLLAVSLLIPAAQSARACSCSGPNPICSVYFGSPVIFRGTVIEKTLERPPLQEVRNLDGSTSHIMTPGIYKVRLSVSEAFRGAEGKQELTVSTNEQSSACGFPFEVGNEYLVFTYKDKAGDRLWTSKCSKTHALKDSNDADLAWMRGLAAAPPGGTIFGHLMLSRTEPFTRGAVTIRGAANHDVAPDTTGGYEVKSLPAGEYKVTMTAAPGFTSPAERTVTIEEKGCAEVDWYVSYDGHVRGRVTDVDGAPIGHMMLNLEKKDANSARGMSMVNLKETDQDGHYDFPQVAPGDYIVIANNLGASPARPFPKVYYPASSTLGGAVPIQVSASGSVDGVDIVMPRAWKKVTISATVLQEDGSPASGVTVYGREVKNQSSVEPMMAVTGTDGTVTLPVYDGQEYYLTALLSGGTQQHCGGPLRVLARSGVQAGTIKISHPWGNCLAQLNPSFRPPQ